MGNQLFAQVIGLSGLPEDKISEELKLLLDSKGVAPEQLTLDSLREVMIAYSNQIREESPEALEALPATTVSHTPMRSNLS